MESGRVPVSPGRGAIGFGNNLDKHVDAAGFAHANGWYETIRSWPRGRVRGIAVFHRSKKCVCEIQLDDVSMGTPDDTVRSDKAPDPVGLYPHARRVGNLLFLSGIGPRERGNDEIPGVVLDTDGNVAEYDIAMQCHSVFKNVRTVLEDAGSSWSNLVDVTVFLTNLTRDFDTYNRIYAEYFADNQPCRTTVEVTKLPTAIAIELKCIASLD